MIDQSSHYMHADQFPGDLSGYKATHYNQTITTQNYRSLQNPVGYAYSSTLISREKQSNQQNLPFFFPPSTLQIATFFNTKHKPSLAYKPTRLCRY